MGVLSASISSPAFYKRLPNFPPRATTLCSAHGLAELTPPSQPPSASFLLVTEIGSATNRGSKAGQSEGVPGLY